MAMLLQQLASYLVAVGYVVGVVCLLRWLNVLLLLLFSGSISSRGHALTMLPNVGMSFIWSTVLF